MRTVLRNWCGSCLKGRAKHSDVCPTREPPGLLAVRDCRVSSRSMSESSPSVLVLSWRTHGAERDCQVVREATEPHAVDCVRYVPTLGARVKYCPKETANLPPRCSSMRWKSSAVRRQRWKKVRNVCISRAARLRTLCRGSRA